MGIKLRVRGEKLGDPLCIDCGHRGYHEPVPAGGRERPGGLDHEYVPDNGSDVKVEYRYEDAGPATGWREVSFRRSLKYVQHSPTGFSWGYGGSGPSQLAFAILETCCDSRDAQKHYQRLKFATLALVVDQMTAFEFVVDVERFLIERPDVEPNTEERSRHVEYVAGFAPERVPA